MSTTEQAAKHFANKGYFTFNDVMREFGLRPKQAQGIMRNILGSQKYKSTYKKEDGLLHIKITEIKRKPDANSETVVMYGEKYRTDLWRKAIFGVAA